MNDRKYMILHHSTTKDGRTYNTEAIRRYHVEVLKWKDIGYHYIVERINDSFKIIPGRSVCDVGAHTLGFNDRSIGICLVGNHDAYAPPLKMMITMIGLIRSLQIAFKIPTVNVIGHRDSYYLLNKIPEKTCPGSKVLMYEVREALA